MGGPPATLLRLELETQAYHRDADHRWLALVAPDVTRAQYADQLAKAYSVEAPLEAALAYTPHVTTMLGRRARSRLLAQDLFTLDFPMHKVRPHLIAPFANLADALGWLYAIERTARLHDMIRRNITVRVPDVAEAMTYITDPHAAQRWSDLGEVLERVGATDKIIYAAHDAFRCMLDWYIGDEEALRRGA